MNGIDKITERIGSDTQKEIDAVLQRAEKEAASIRSSFHQMAEDEYSAALERGRKNADERIERLGGVAGLDAKKLVLASKQEMLGVAFARALTKLTELPESEYVSLLARLAANASGAGDEEIVLSQGDRTRYGKQVVVSANELLEKAGRPAHLTLSEESRDIRGGLYLKSGNIENNCTFETIVRLLRESFSGDVAAVLFAD